MVSFKEVVNESHHSQSFTFHFRVPILPTVSPGFVSLNLNFNSSFHASSIIDMLAQGLYSSPSMIVNLSMKLDDHNYII